MADARELHSERAALLAKPEEIIVYAAYLYPLKGFYLCLRYKFMWPLFRTRFIPCLVISLIVLPTLFIVAYLPQVAFLAIFQGPLAWFNAVFLVLGEAASIIALLFEAFFVDEALVQIFDAILIHEGFTELVATRRTIIAGGADPLQQLGPPKGDAVYSPFSFRLSFEYLFFLPLTFIPLAGGPLYCLVLGRRAGPFHHWRYFKLLGLSDAQRKAAIAPPVEVHVVRHGRADAAARAYGVHGVPAHDGRGRRAVGRGLGAEEAARAGRRRDDSCRSVTH